MLATAPAAALTASPSMAQAEKEKEEAPRVARLAAAVQSYEWGCVGPASAIAPLLPAAVAGPAAVLDAARPYAEVRRPPLPLAAAGPLDSVLTRHSPAAHTHTRTHAPAHHPPRTYSSGWARTRTGRRTRTPSRG